MMANNARVTVSADPVDLSHHFSDTTLNRKASSVKDFYKYFLIPGIGNLAGGPSTVSAVGVLTRLIKSYRSS